MAIAALVALFIGSMLYALGGGFGGRNPMLLLSGRIAAGLAALLLTGLLITRSILIGFPALTGTYEGLLLTVLAIAAAVALGSRILFRSSGALLSASLFVAFVLMAVLSSPLISDELHPPMPVLRSGWLVLHVAFAFVGLALFTVGTVAAIAGLAAGRSGAAPEARPAASRADTVRDRSTILGFVFYATGGLVFGAIWAEAAWGRFWGWDPKETWALVTTLVYAIYLHLRFIQKVRPVVSRIVAIIAWAMAIFTFFGVNYLLAGLHSYA